MALITSVCGSIRSGSSAGPSALVELVEVASHPIWQQLRIWEGLFFKRFSAETARQVTMLQC